MKDKDIDSNEQQDNAEKVHVSKSVFKTAKEMQEQRLAEMEEQQRKLEQQAAERQKKKREEYERRLLEEKKELIRLKQGQVQESELIHEETPKEIKLSPLKKISNFFYHNKWWLGIAVLFVCVGIFLIYDLVSRERPDIVVLVVADNDDVGNSSDLSEYIEQFTKDFNDNGEILASVYYMPYTDNAQKNYANGTDTKLTAELQSADGMIVIGGDNITKILEPNEAFIDLEELFPDNPHIKGTAFYLKDTDFAEKIGLTDDALGDDLFISFRKPQDLLAADEEDMQETYDKDFPVLEAIIKDLSK